MIATMILLRAHYDGKVLVPDEPLELKPNQQVRISVEPLEPLPEQFSRRDLSHWLGLGLTTPTNPTPRFTTNDQLWEKDK